MKTIVLTHAHGHALAQFLGAFDAAGEAKIPGYFADREWSAERVADTLSAWASGEALPNGWVACSTRFAVEDRAILGVVNFRHRLTPSLERFGGHVGYAVRPEARGRGVATFLLRDAMAVAHSHGLDELVLTCGPDNVASARVIAKCGGQLTARYWHEGQQRDVLRWRVPLQ